MVGQCMKAPWGAPFFAYETIYQIAVLSAEVSGLEHCTTKMKDDRGTAIAALVWFLLVGWAIGLVLLAMGIFVGLLSLIVDLLLVIVYLITLAYCCSFTPSIWWKYWQENKDGALPPNEEGASEAAPEAAPEQAPPAEENA